jgi:putative transcriptional regulator
MSKRDVFSELMEGFDALEAERQGKLTLRKHKVEALPEVEVASADILALRTRLRRRRPETG